MPNDHEDRLLDVLLEEELGADAPPDLTEAVLARARAGRGRRFAAVLLPLAAAAAVALVWGFLRPGYPPPRATGPYVLLGGGALDRGAMVATQRETATLSLGGYCLVHMEPLSVVTIEGRERGEAVFLSRGGVTCQVDRGRGEFMVRTALGSVKVTGTRFCVRLLEEEGDPDMSGRRMLVQVLAGAVIAAGSWGSATLQAGEKAVLPEGEKKAATREEKTERPREKKAEPAREKRAEAAGDERRGAEGTARGILTAKGESWIEVKTDGEERSRRYLPFWRGGAPGEGGGFDRTMLETIRKLVVPNRVEVQWKQEEHRRIVSVRTSSSEGKSGTVTGELTDKGENWIEVKPEGGVPERYMPHWVGNARGGFDKDMLAVFRTLSKGDKVRVRWTGDERRRAVEVKKAGE